MSKQNLEKQEKDRKKHEKKRLATCELVKIFSTPFKYQKVIYKGTLRGCKKRIKPSQKDRFKINFI